MELVEPRVELIAETKLDKEGLSNYLDDIGATNYEIDDEISDLENLIMVGGKACYKSFQVGLNPNISRVRDDSGDYLANINKTGHGSVTEHGNVSFMFWNVSRVFTHELVRHRAGTAMSQESLRFVRLDNLKFWLPSCIKESKEATELMIDTVEYLEGKQKELAKIFDIDNIKEFSRKKVLTSSFRRIAPDGLATAIMWTMNIRTARHLIQIRTSRHAEEEIRLVFDQVAALMVEKYPSMFSDFSYTMVDGIREWVASNASMPYDNEKISALEKEIKKLKEKVVKLEDERSVNKIIDDLDFESTTG